MTDDLKLFLASDYDDNYILRCKVREEMEPIRERSLTKEGKDIYIKTGERPYIFIQSIQVVKDGKIIPPSMEIKKE